MADTSFVHLHNHSQYSLLLDELLELGGAVQEGVHYRPRIDRELLERHGRGLIATSTCLGGEIPQLILSGRQAEAERVACEYREIFGAENFFFEIQDQGLPQEKLLNEI